MNPNDYSQPTRFKLESANTWNLLHKYPPVTTSGNQFADLLGRVDNLLNTDLAKLNDAAKKLAVPELYIPPAKKKDEVKK